MRFSSFCHKFLATTTYQVEIHKSQPSLYSWQCPVWQWESYQVLTIHSYIENLAKFNCYLTNFNVLLAALLCQLAALRSFSPEKLQYWRERESGMSSLAYFLARDTIDHFNTAVKPIIFLSTFYFFNNPRSTLRDNYLVLLALIYCVTGIGYTFSVWFELGLAQLVSKASSNFF